VVGGGGWDGARMGCSGLQEWGRGAGVEGYRSGEGRMKSLAETREGLDQYHFFFFCHILGDSHPPFWHSANLTIIKH